MEKQSIGRNLVFQRKLKGLTQELLSDKSNITIRTIQRIEKEEVKPQLQTIRQLANALELEVEELIPLENPKEEALQNKWLLFLHGSPLLGFIFPFSVLFPLFIWIHKRDDNPLYDKHGIRVINFQLTMTIVLILASISLVTIEKWGFLFFICVIPFNMLVITYNVFRVLRVRKCFYPFSINFLKNGPTNKLRKIFPLLLFSFSLLWSCSSPKEKSAYEKLLSYEGRYEYINNTTLDLIASELDTTLYAVINKAKYPLNYISVDSFRDIQGAPVTFERDLSNQIKAYQTGGQFFNLITKDIEKKETLPRRALFRRPEAYTYQVPKKRKDGLETGHLANEFNHPEPIIAMIQKTIAGTYPDVHSILIYKNEKLVLEEYFYGYDENTPHQLRSATKPIIGGILGIAVDQGFIENEQALLLPFFELKYPKIEYLNDQKKSITIENFLTYQHGMDCENDNPKSKGNELLMMESEDWVKYTLDLPMLDKPGKSSSYCTGCPLTIGSLIEIVTKSDIEDFAKNHLFTPMGISNYSWVFEPNQTSKDHFSQTSFTPRDLIKLAKLFKDGGKWKGRQIISKDWIDKTFKQSSSSYGYFWEHKYFEVNGQQYHSYLASGNGGQKINIWPELDMITVFTGGNYNSYQLYGKSTPPNEMIPNYILKALDSKLN